MSTASLMLRICNQLYERKLIGKDEFRIFKQMVILEDEALYSLNFKDDNILIQVWCVNVPVFWSN